MSAGLTIFVLTYLLISARRLDWLGLDRPGVALAGAIACVATGALSPQAALHAIDANTILLLFGVMGMGASLASDGFFERASLHLAARAKTPTRLLGAIIWGSGLLSALLTNDAVCILGAPLVVTLIKRHKLPATPFLLAIATAANTGSVATLVGNPQNMLCASLGQLSFSAYLRQALPIALICLALNHALLHLLWRSKLREAASLDTTHTAEALPLLLTRSTWLSLATITTCAILYTLGLPMAWTAAGGTVALLILQRRPAAQVWAHIDWSLLLFFCGLFIVVEALITTHLPAQLFAHLQLWQGPPLTANLKAAGLFLVGANIVSNVPFILVIKDQLSLAADPQRAWTLLAIASTFAGNLTLLGSVANIIVAQAGHEVGGLSFWTYLRVGLPLATISTLIAALYLSL